MDTSQSATDSYLSDELDVREVPEVVDLAAMRVPFAVAVALVIHLVALVTMEVAVAAVVVTAVAETAIVAVDVWILCSSEIQF